MISVDTLTSALLSMHHCNNYIGYGTRGYQKFHDDMMKFIYSNHFENTREWEQISNNLIYNTSGRMWGREVNEILVQLDSLKRKVLRKENDGFWSHVHPQIYQVTKERFNGGFYADAVESAFKEINFRVKQIYKKNRGEEKDGQDLMRKAFSTSSKFLIFESLETESGKNVQEGYMQIFAGAMQGIRNPKAHANMTVSREDAIKRLVFASLLMDKIDEALEFSNIEE